MTGSIFYILEKIISWTLRLIWQREDTHLFILRVILVMFFDYVGG